MPQDHSFLKLLDELITRETSWSEKHKRQHRSVGKLFVKFVGSDDCRDMTQKHVVGFLEMLAFLPKNHGKSSKEEALTIEEILSKGRAAQRAAEREFEKRGEINSGYTLKRPKILGLDTPTIYRYKKQLLTILKHCSANGYVISGLAVFSGLNAIAAEDEDQKEARGLAECI